MCVYTEKEKERRESNTKTVVLMATAEKGEPFKKEPRVGVFFFFQVSMLHQVAAAFTITPVHMVTIWMDGCARGCSRGDVDQLLFVAYVERWGGGGEHQTTLTRDES